MYQISKIKTEPELLTVLDLCYDILGEHLKNTDNYRQEDWIKRLGDENEILLYAHENNNVIAAVLGRKENNDSMVIGFVACHEKNRRRGITKNIIKCFISQATALGYKYITLGAADDALEFYEKCGFKLIDNIHGQNIFQKIL